MFTSERSSQSAKDVGATARRSKIEHTNRVKAVPTKKKASDQFWQFVMPEYSGDVIKCVRHMKMRGRYFTKLNR